MDYRIKELNAWKDSNVGLVDAFSEKALRSMAIHLLMGRNYRLLTEQNTKSKQVLTHLWLSDLQKSAIAEFGDDWRHKLLDDLQGMKKKTNEHKLLELLLVGLTRKTLTNLGGGKEHLGELLGSLEKQIWDLLGSINRSEDMEQAWLLMMAGAATLSIRGADKSKIGKKFEKVFIRSALSILGLVEGEDFRMNIDRDEEVGRETDAEVETRRSSIRIEMGLIAEGNQEVTEDKIKRVGRNGIVIFDKIGTKSRITGTAQDEKVKLIQIRHGNPLKELYDHLSPLCKVELCEPPATEKAITAAVDKLPASIFQ